METTSFKNACKSLLSRSYLNSLTIYNLMFKLWLLTTISAIKFIKDLLRNIHRFILMPSFTLLSCSMMTPINLVEVKGKTNEEEEAEAEAIKEEAVETKEVGTLTIRITIMEVDPIKINIITMILINID